MAKLLPGQSAWLLGKLIIHVGDLSSTPDESIEELRFDMAPRPRLLHGAGRSTIVVPPKVQELYVYDKTVTLKAGDLQVLGQRQPSCRWGRRKADSEFAHR